MYLDFNGQLVIFAEGSDKKFYYYNGSNWNLISNNEYKLVSVRIRNGVPTAQVQDSNGKKFTIKPQGNIISNSHQ